MGTGILDLKRLMEICRKGNPDVWFNLEMITRDPLEIPVFKETYWTTMPNLPAPDLASTLKLAKSGMEETLPIIAGKDLNAQFDYEEENIQKSFDYGRRELGFA